MHFSSPRLLRLFALCLVAATVLAALSGCGRRRRRKTPMYATVIDFRFTRVGHHHNLVSADQAAVNAAMGAVVVSPNLVFEGSRPSGPEPHLQTPSRPASDDVTPSHAAGEPIKTAFGQRLLSRLQAKGAQVVAPAWTQQWASWRTCKEEQTCPSISWVERALDATSAEGALHPVKGVLAVRRLFAGPMPIPVVVRQNAEETGPDFIVTQRDSYAEFSECDDLALRAPGVWLQAELLEPGTGRLLAQFDHKQFATLKKGLRNQEIELANLAMCELIQVAFQRAVRSNMATVKDTAGLVDRVFEQTVDGLFAPAP